MNNRTTTTTADKTNPAPNVIIITRKRQIASFAALILPLPILLGSLALLPLDKINLEATFAFLVACSALPLILVHWVYPADKDSVHLTPYGLSFKQHGEVPFSSIKAYTLEGGIRLTRHDNPPLTLIGNKKTPGYEDFRKAFRAAMAAWSEDATSDQVKQQHFFGTALAKVMGALIVIICGGLIIATMILKMGMSALPALAIATFTGVRLLFSRRQE